MCAIFTSHNFCSPFVCFLHISSYTCAVRTQQKTRARPRSRYELLAIGFIFCYWPPLSISIQSVAPFAGEPPTNPRGFLTPHNIIIQVPMNRNEIKTKSWSIRNALRMRTTNNTKCELQRNKANIVCEWLSLCSIIIITNYLLFSVFICSCWTECASVRCVVQWYLCQHPTYV